MSPRPPKLKLQDVSLDHVNERTRQLLPVLRGIDFDVEEGELVCIVGPSGCGKTTFLRCIAGLTDVSDGELLVGGKPVAGPPAGVAMVFQHFGLLPWKTVRQNAAFGLAMAGAPSAQIEERVRHYLELVGLIEKMLLIFDVPFECQRPKCNRPFPRTVVIAGPGDLP